jgi:glycerophosphoryl diester phosphodiesterase
LGRLLLEELRAFGYSSAEDRVFVQCFDHAEITRLKVELGCELPLIQLVGPEPEYARVCTASGLRSVSAYAYGVGPHFSQLVQAQGGPPTPSEFARGAADAGLRVHAYTFRREDVPAFAATFEHLLEIFLGQIGVDGVFSDHPDVAVRVRDSLHKVHSSAPIR